MPSGGWWPEATSTWSSSAASAIAESAWTAAFLALGKFSQARPRVWQPLGGGTVLVVAPHPDDETLGCGGTLIRHRRAGDRVLVLVVTDGRASGAGALSPDEMAARRLVEARNAAAQLGVDLESLSLPEGGWQASDLEVHLRDYVGGAEVSILYAPSPVDYHPEHLRVARALAAALSWAAHPPRVRVCELGVPLGATLTNVVVPTTSVERQRRAALDAYATQAMGIAGLARLRRYAGVRWLGGGIAEPFWELSPAAYRAVVAAGDWGAGAAKSPFRGLRPRAFGDPLSYLVAQAARRRLARVAAQVLG